MAVTLLVGPEDTTQNVNNNPRDMEANVYELEPNISPLLSLTSKLNSKPAINPKFEWLENESMPRITTLSASSTATAVSWGVTADIFRVGDVIRETVKGYGILVTATAAGSISGSAVGGTSQVSSVSGDELYLVANANTEGASLREIKFPQLVNASNYCEIVRTPFGLTNTEKATTHYGGDEEARLKNFAGREQARALEQIAFFGLRDLKATNERLSGGILEFISTNSQSGATFTEAVWQSFLKMGFRYGSERKVCFCSPTLLGLVEGFARANLKVNDNRAETYGVTMKTYYSGQGIVDLVLHRDWADSTAYGAAGILVDLDAFKYRPLRDTKLKQNVQAPDYDGVKSEYITEAGFEIQHERRHAKITAVAA